MQDAAAFYDEQLPGDEIAVRTCEEKRCANDIGGGLDPFEDALIDAFFAPLADLLGH